MSEAKKYNELVSQVSTIYTEGKRQAVAAVNKHITLTYWQVGEHIVIFEQGGKVKTGYGKKLIERLSKDLTLLHGKGFSLSNVKRMRQLYVEYPKSATQTHQLSWLNRLAI